MKQEGLIARLEIVATQADFAALIGVSEARASQLAAEGVLPRGATARAWLLAYCERLREVAAGRASEAGGLDLVQERAALAREQRIGYEIKNAVARKEYAPITLLAETLAMASQVVVERFEHLPGALKKACPELPEAARVAVMTTIAAARNEWVERTRQLAFEQLVDNIDEAQGDEGPDE